MSLILDALRKSEAERRQGQLPDLFARLPSPIVHPRARVMRRWPWVLAGVAVLVALFAWQRVSDPVTGVSLPARVVHAPSSALADKNNADSSQAPNTVPVLAPSAATPTARKDSRAKTTPAHIPTTKNAVDAHTAVPDGQLPVVVKEPVLIGESTPPRDPVENLAMLSASERSGLPLLKLSMHVFSLTPTRRMAIIDGQRVIEGSSIGGNIVEEIRRDGVVLNIAGRRILLPRP